MGRRAGLARRQPFRRRAQRIERRRRVTHRAGERCRALAGRLECVQRVRQGVEQPVLAMRGDRQRIEIERRQRDTFVERRTGVARAMRGAPRERRQLREHREQARGAARMGEADDRHVPHHLAEDRVAPAAQVSARAEHDRQHVHAVAKQLGHQVLDGRRVHARVRRREMQPASGGPHEAIGGKQIRHRVAQQRAHVRHLDHPRAVQRAFPRECDDRAQRRVQHADRHARQRDARDLERAQRNLDARAARGDEPLGRHPAAREPQAGEAASAHARRPMATQYLQLAGVDRRLKRGPIEQQHRMAASARPRVGAGEHHPRVRTIGVVDDFLRAVQHERAVRARIRFECVAQEVVAVIELVIRGRHLPAAQQQLAQFALLGGRARRPHADGRDERRHAVADAERRVAPKHGAQPPDHLRHAIPAPAEARRHEFGIHAPPFEHGLRVGGQRFAFVGIENARVPERVGRIERIAERLLEIGMRPGRVDAAVRALAPGQDRIGAHAASPRCSASSHGSSENSRPSRC
ncbi:hypothetical protein DO73_4991 [Burkholderia pseudomallei]|nr:hypothetical protein DO73_4991 [Burkholderia pseudomallei]